MKTYLRFTPAEYRALSRACRSIDLHDDFFPVFQHFLVSALRAHAPDLANRIANFRKYQIGIVFEHLKARRKAADQADDSTGQRAPRHALTPQERQKVSCAAGAYTLPAGFPHVFRDYLVQHFQETAPDLSRKLAYFSDRQMERLFTELKSSRRWTA